MKKLTYEEFLKRKKTRGKIQAKYKNRSVWVNGYVFQSTFEGMRYKQLLILEENGTIEQLELQPKFRLLQGFKVKTNEGFKTQYPIQYFADFRYLKNGMVVVEDTKGYETETYKIKKKIFLFRLGEFGVDVFREIKIRKVIEYFKEK